MKKYTLLFLALLFIPVVYGQNYLISTYNGQTVQTCSGKSFDSGGASGGYNANQTYVMTFSSNSTTNTHIKLSFNDNDIHPTDTLYVYDGSTVNAPLLTVINSALYPVQFPIYATVLNSSGDLTLKFVSNGASNGNGWDADVSCTPVCQSVLSSIDSAMTQLHDSNYIDICFGDTVTFMAKGIYPQNNIVYAQDDLTSTFFWDFGDGTTGTGRIIDHFYSTIRGYNIMLTVTDVNGCVSMNSLGTRVRISDDPVGHVSSLPDICSGTELNVNVGYASTSTINVTLPSYYQSASLTYDSATFIPDGGAIGGACYNTNVTFNAFLPGQTVTSASDIVSVIANMEHSFVGDLKMTLICPNGQQAVLKEYIQSGGAYLGEPYGGTNHGTFDCTAPGCVTDPLQNPAGVGYTYSFSMNPVYGTMQSYANAGNMNPSPFGVAEIDSSSYQPFEPFSQMIGCPLNGTWNFQVCDYWAIDNGWVFWWNLNLDASILPVNWGYVVPIDTVIWNGPYITNYGDNKITINPDTGGVFSYNVQIIDEFSCTYDTTVNLTVVAKPKIDLGPDTAMCEGAPITLHAPTYPNGTYYWLPEGVPSQDLLVDETGEYVAIIMTGNGNIQCDGMDTIRVDFWPEPLISFIPDEFEGCQPVTVKFSNGTTQASEFLWDFGDGVTSTDAEPEHIYTTPGEYNVTLTAYSGKGCEDVYSVNKLIKVYSQPEASFSASPEVATVANAQVTFTNASTNSTNALWIFGDGESSNDQNPVHNYKDKGVYDVWLYLESEHGCKDSVTMKITIIDDLLEIPNIITPNSDGKNDAFVVKNLDAYLSNELFIYDRWGKKVYFKSNYQNDWDGENHADGTYYYVLRCKGLITDQEITGTITIIGKQ